MNDRCVAYMRDLPEITGAFNISVSNISKGSVMPCFEPLHPLFGATVGGVDLTVPLADVDAGSEVVA
jgi:hypothetical protein